MDADILLFFFVGRLVFAAYWIYNGFNHLKDSKSMAEYVASKKIPYPEAAVILSGAFILLGGIGILLGIYPYFAIALISIFLIVVTYKMHDFWNTRDQQTKMFDRIQFFKNLALLGATLMLLAVPTPWPWSL